MLCRMQLQQIHQTPREGLWVGDSGEEAVCQLAHGPSHLQSCTLRGGMRCFCPSGVGLARRILLGGTLCIAKATAMLTVVV